MAASGLTTTAAPFIEEAKSNGEIYIRQPYELYSEELRQEIRLVYREDIARLQDMIGRDLSHWR